MRNVYELIAEHDQIFKHHYSDLRGNFYYIILIIIVSVFLNFYYFYHIFIIFFRKHSIIVIFASFLFNIRVTGIIQGSKPVSAGELSIRNPGCKLPRARKTNNSHCPALRRRSGAIGRRTRKQHRHRGGYRDRDWSEFGHWHGSQAEGRP